MKDNLILDCVYKKHEYKRKQTYKYWLDISVVGKKCPREVYLYSLGLSPLLTPEIACVYEDELVHKKDLLKRLGGAGYILSNELEEITGGLEYGLIGTIDAVSLSPKETILHIIEAVSEYEFEGFSLYDLKEYRSEYYYKVQVLLHITGYKKCELRVKNKNTGAIELLPIDYNKGDALAALDFVRKLRDGYVPEVPDFEKYLEKYNNELISKWEQRVARFNKGELNQQYPPKKPTLLASPSEAREKFCKHCLMAEHCTKKGELNG